MQFPESWLREFCNPPLTTDALANLLTMAGMEVEEVRPVAPPCSGVVVAEVLSVDPHPQAGKLKICSVNVGNPSPLQIVCGASNVRPGIKVPCALVGAELTAIGREQGASALKISSGILRGVESHGMLCSAAELHLTSDVNGLLVLDAGAVVGANIREHLDLDDSLFTLKLTPNLGHVLSLWGVAREVSALTGAPLSRTAAPQIADTAANTVPVHIEASDLCGRFSGRVVQCVNPDALTPRWMVERLARCGQRSVNALVDISNYVMLETGQPSHIFDLDKIRGGLTVRWANPNERLQLLDGNSVILDSNIGVIADDQAVQSMAGIMGGQSTAVSNQTCNVYIEVAFWWPEAVAGRARRFNFSTEAGHRYERGVDPAGISACLQLLTHWVLEICGGQPGPITDHCLMSQHPTFASGASSALSAAAEPPQSLRPSKVLPDRKVVRLRVARAVKVIGMPLTQADCVDVLQRLGFSFVELPGELLVTPPSWRFDLQIEEDLIEEIVRLIGYDKLPSNPPIAAVVARAPSESNRGVHSVRHLIAKRDYFETINLSFVDEWSEANLAANPQPVRLLNPIVSSLNVMRSSLIGGLVAVLCHNVSRKQERVRVFEIGRVFHRDSTALSGPLAVAGVRQPLQVAGLAWGPVHRTQWGCPERRVDFFDVKGDLEAMLAPRVAKFQPAPHPALHPGRSACIELQGQIVGFIGELHPRWRQHYELPMAPVVFELALSALMARDLPSFSSLPRQQSVWRDIAVLAGLATTSDSLIDAVRNAHPFIRSAVLFDVYQPAQGPATPLVQRSLGVRIEMEDDNAALSEDRIEAVMAEVVLRVTQLGCALRGA